MKRIKERTKRAERYCLSFHSLQLCRRDKPVCVCAESPGARRVYWRMRRRTRTKTTCITMKMAVMR
ncbi:hypothetical protein Dsin_025531 [Dipteronia sinensis]|uniref:Uncharacterized protein n=1 Tax=Dipteronia sinensis TaxID=43782 RepID=A0AAE0DX76_9ROSI|nr:hypothetical protein Dsin_025531 [Dipteronia sinensis]